VGLGARRRTWNGQHDEPFLFEFVHFDGARRMDGGTVVPGMPVGVPAPSPAENSGGTRSHGGASNSGEDSGSRRRP
jgi:hypothetical protein